MECSPEILYNNYNLIRVINTFPCGLAYHESLRLMAKLGGQIASEKELFKMGEIDDAL